MSARRPALRGQGYMRKGGAAATRAHNVREQRLSAEEHPRDWSDALAVEADARTDARGSASAGRAPAIAPWAWAFAGYFAGILNALVVF